MPSIMLGKITASPSGKQLLFARGQDVARAKGRDVPPFRLCKMILADGCGADINFIEIEIFSVIIMPLLRLTLRAPCAAEIPDENKIIP